VIANGAILRVCQVGGWANACDTVRKGFKVPVAPTAAVVEVKPYCLVVVNCSVRPHLPPPLPLPLCVGGTFVV